TLAAALGIALAAYAVAAGFAYAHLVDTSPLLKPSLASVRKVSAVVERESSPGERVLSSWPGYLVGTHADSWPGYTNHFAPAAAAHVSAAEARRVHVVSEAQLEAAIRPRLATRALRGRPARSSCSSTPMSSSIRMPSSASAEPSTPRPSSPRSSAPTTTTPRTREWCRRFGISCTTTSTTALRALPPRS